MGANKSAESANITKMKVFSNYGKVLELVGGVTTFQYFESIFDPTIRASAQITDTGFRNGRNKVSGIEKDDLHLTVGEKSIISVTDNRGGSLDLEMRVREVGNMVERTQSIGYTMDWYSIEAINNELRENRVVKRYDGKITDYVPQIIKDNLKTSKSIKVDPCINKFNFLGHVQKPFYILSWLAKRTAPDVGPLGDLAGYLFWETSNGYNYRSIDKIFLEKKIVRRLIFTNTEQLPGGYDGKILDYSWSDKVSLDKKLLTSAYNKSEMRGFDIYSHGYGEDEFDSTKQFQYDNIGGLEKPKVASDINLESKSSRVNSNFYDTGVLPPGSTLGAQLPFSKDINFNTNEIVRQSFVRYNNLFSHKLSIKIPGDFGIHAGDLVWCDFPEVSDKVQQIISEKKSGIYMVIDISHYVTPRGTWTGINLARESILRPPLPKTPLFKNSADAEGL